MRQMLVFLKREVRSAAQRKTVKGRVHILHSKPVKVESQFCNEERPDKSLGNKP